LQELLTGQRIIDSQSRRLERVETRRCAMGVAIEISCALWIMIGCLAMEASQIIQYLN
jgi:hypothetical protein